MAKETVVEEGKVVEERSLPCQHKIDSIIRDRVHASLAVGLVPVPLVDAAALFALQSEMLYRLCSAYNVPFKAEPAKKLLGVVAASALPVLLTPSLRSLARYIPVVGFGLGVVSTSLAGGAATYALGHAFAKHFASGGTLLDVNTAKIVEEVKETYENGKEVVKGWVKKKDDKAPQAAEQPAV